jgi:hypothetical protein
MGWAEQLFFKPPSNASAPPTSDLGWFISIQIFHFIDLILKLTAGCLSPPSLCFGHHHQEPPCCKVREIQSSLLSPCPSGIRSMGYLPLVSFLKYLFWLVLKATHSWVPLCWVHGQLLLLPYCVSLYFFDLRVYQGLLSSLCLPMETWSNLC